MDTRNNLNYNTLIFDVILYKSDIYDLILDDSEITLDIKKPREIEYYDIEVIKTVPFDVKLDYSQYYDFELVNNHINYFPEEILTELGNEILTELGEFIMTEDDVYIIY
jgi:hypothetical protein